MAQDYICPVDRQNLEWHLKVHAEHPDGRKIYFGDRLGCGFISPIDRLQHEQPNDNC